MSIWENYHKRLKEINKERDILIKITNEFIQVIGTALMILESLKDDIIRVVVDSNFSEEEKISKIRNKILESKAQEINVDDQLHQYVNKDMSPKLLESVNELIEIMSKSYNEGSEFRNKIADVIRDRDLTINTKLEEISNILM